MQLPVTNPGGQELVATHDLREITELLIKHHELHEGMYDLAIEFQIAVGGVGMDSSSILPGVMLNIRRIGLTKATKIGLTTVDAAEVNLRKVVKKAAEKKVTAKKTTAKETATKKVAAKKTTTNKKIAAK